MKENTGIVVVVSAPSNGQKIPIMTVGEETFVDIEYKGNGKAVISSKVMAPLSKGGYEILRKEFYIEHNKHVIEAAERWKARRV